MIRTCRSMGGIAVLLVLMILLPAMQAVDAQEDAKAKIAPALSNQLTAAKPGEYVSAVVRMTARPNLQMLRGDQYAVCRELRTVSKQSQAGLMSYLGRAGVADKVSVTRQFWIDNLVLVKATPEVIREIATRPDVAEVFDNFTITVPPRSEGDRPVLGQAQTQLWDSIKKIGAKQVWNSYGITGSGVLVGGLDTGVQGDHPDLVGKMRTTVPGDPTFPGGWAEFDSNGNIIAGSVPHDSDEHGTHTTGTAVGGNASGYSIGVAPGATFMHGLVLPGGSGSFTQVVGGMEWVIDPDNNPATQDGARVCNMSLGATGTYTQMITPTDNMCAANCFPSFSIGNSGPSASTTGSPGNVPSAFGVGAVDSMDVIASFSSRGPVTWNSPPYVGTWTKPDISAPGVKIFSSIPGGTWQWHGDGWDWSGTSMAAPHVTGTVALMIQANPTLTVDAIKQILSQTAIDQGTAGMDNDYGWGRINAYAAVTAALAGVGTLQGTIYSSAGGTVENAKILLTDTGQKIYSDATGFYTMKAVAGTHPVEISRFGYETFTTTVEVTADVVTTLDATLTQLPSGSVAGFVTDAGTGAGIQAAIAIRLAGETVLSTATNPTTGEYGVVLPVGTYDFVYSPSFPYPLATRTGIVVTEGATTTVNLALEPAQVLIVDDDAGKGYQTYFEQSVLASGRSYLTVTTPPDAATMALFSAVVWLTGNDYGATLTAADIAALTAYLDGGGRLFISGQDIGYDISTDPFYANYLHAHYVQDDVGLGGVLGVAANPVGFGFTFDIKGGTGANNQAYPSEIDPVGGALQAFVYDPSVPAAAATSNEVVKQGELETEAITSTGTAGITFENGVYKLVYFAFGFEAVADASTRDALMMRVLDWLQGYPKIAHTPLGDTEDSEHPYPVTATITSEYFPLDPSTFALIYDAGAGDVTVPLASTGNPDEYAAEIPAQPIGTEIRYYLTASDVPGHTAYDPMGAPALRHVFHVAWDTAPPTVAHIYHRNTNDLVGPYNIWATVTDNTGVESVYLMYAKNGGMYHRVKMLLQPDGRYLGYIPGPSIVGDYYEYYLYAMDEATNGNVTRMPETGVYRFEIVEYFLWDFEPDDGQFAEMGGVWEWGAPLNGPGAAHSGANVWATILAGDYPASANATLDGPPITLSANNQYAYMTIWHWYSMETNYDGGNMKLSTDNGATWNVITPMGGYDGTARTTNAGIPGEPCFTGYNNQFWQQEFFDLSAYAGQSIMFRFHFGSDGSVQKPGWYIDDVLVRSTDVDDIPPIISGTTVPGSTFDVAGPYAVTTNVTDPLSGVATVSLFYSTDGGATFTEVAMAPGTGTLWLGGIPGQPNGTRIKFYVKAVDSASLANETLDPSTAPAATYEFSILPSAPILAVVGSSSATPIAMFQDALAANGRTADFWNRTTQGWLALDKLSLYQTIIIDETSGLTAQQMTDLSAWLASGSEAAKKKLYILGRDLAYNSTTRPWVEQYLRASYVQDNPNYWQITGYPGEMIGADETFVISGSYPDEMQRSITYPGGEIVYQYTGTGTSRSYDELKGEYEKEGKEWDNVVPDAPKSLDAAAAIKYSGATYRSVYFAFNFYYIQEPVRRAAVIDRVLRWLGSPEIAHTPLHDTENTTDPYVVSARIVSATLDPTRLFLTYDVGAGAVQVAMTATGAPNEYAASIPPQPNGTTVQYYLSAANLDGTTAYDPQGAPAVQHTFEVNTDSEPPVIVHAPLGNSADMIGPYVITATITDNVGVDPGNVFVNYTKNGAPAVLPMTAMGGDLYRAEIPGPSALGDVYAYYILARDVASVPNVARHPASGYHTFTIVDYYAWDFEPSNGGFTATGPDWEWGDPTTGPMDAHSGVNVWATKLGGDYSASSNSKLDLPPVAVPTSSTYALLSFWQWYYCETNYDGGNVKISTDGGATWTILTPDIGYNGTARSTNAGIPNEPCFTGYTKNFWHKATFNLTPYKGQTVRIRLHFGSDPSVMRVGWYVDDVLIQGVEDTAPPAFISTTVPSSTFDTVGPYTVKSVVRDALSGLASVTLNYSTDAGTSWTPVTMTPTGVADEFSGAIPGQPQRTRIRLYVAAADNASNAANDPAAAPASYYEFGIMPSGDYLVIRGGSAPAPAEMYQAAFTALGRTADYWNWDTQGAPALSVLNAYTAVIIDESFYFDTAQLTLLRSFLNQNDGAKQQVFFLGRDMSYGSGAPRTFMEQYTGTVYVQDNPAWYRLKSTPGDPIGADETFVIAGSYPDEVKLSTTYPGASIVYKYNGVGAALDLFDDEAEAMAFYAKDGKEWDPKMWPMVPSGPDTIAGARFVGPYHACVYFCFQFNYIQEVERRAAILGRALDWLALAASSVSKNDLATDRTPEVPAALTLWQNYPNPFNPVTTITFGVPAGVKGRALLRIYNVKGELVKTLFDGTVQSGIYSYQWTGGNDAGRPVTSGIYFCRFTCGSEVLTRKMVLLR